MTLNKVLKSISKFKEIIFLGTLNFAIFHKYWLGISTPPWDFLGGGMVEQFRFYKDGGFFNPPSWYPYAWFGIPEYQMVQDGGWFIPVWLTSDLFGWHPANAARLQAFLILFGSIGMYKLVKVFIKQKYLSLIAGVLYLFIPVFYSNAQHYSSVRSAALLPWILYFIHPDVLNKSKFNIFFGSIVIFQAITGSYPGNLIASFYTTILYVFSICFPRSQNVLNYLKYLILMSVSGVLMGLIRYLPVLQLQETFPSEVGNQAGVTFYNLIYLILPFVGENIPWGDPTLRSIYIGSFALIVLSFTRLRIKDITPWLFLTLSSIFMMSQNLLNTKIREVIPFLNISRFAITDWRNTFNLSIIVLVVLTLKHFYENNNSQKAGLQYFKSISPTVLILYFGHLNGQSLTNVVIYGLISLIFLIFFFKFNLATLYHKIILLTLITISGIIFVYANSFTWMTTVKEQNFNIYNNTFTNVQESTIYPLKSRPARVTFLPTPLTPENYKNDQRYNRFWLTGGFGAYGYHNIKDINAYSALFPRLEKEDDPVVKFLLSKGKQLAVTNTDNLEDLINECTNSISCPNDLNVQISQKSFDKEREIFEISSKTNFRMIQNEMYSPVWRGKLCILSNCKIVSPEPTLDSLRTWELPAGKYVFETYAETPYSQLRWIIFIFGFSLAIFSTLMNPSKFNRSSTV